MTTLHIEHAITDYDVWKSAFDRFADFRRQAGVLGHRIARPVDDPAYVVIDLDFTTADEATAFLELLRTKIWASPESAPALASTPHTKILDEVA
ncbi:hypothetical protein ACIBG8_04765 [Nonomuraea sp. NPDC050556]|uniref:hypothetical protein n=1 Tax=Nonomuraea sp. NPDC050556 TaxID=3364369 RepID=UPI003797B525